MVGHWHLNKSIYILIWDKSAISSHQLSAWFYLKICNNYLWGGPLILKIRRLQAGNQVRSGMFSNIHEYSWRFTLSLKLLFVWFDSLCPMNNFSVKQGRVFLGWAQGPQSSDAGEARTHGLSVSSQALYHWATASSQALYHWATAERSGSVVECLTQDRKVWWDVKNQIKQNWATALPFKLTLDSPLDRMWLFNGDDLIFLSKLEVLNNQEVHDLIKTTKSFSTNAEIVEFFSYILSTVNFLLSWQFLHFSVKLPSAGADFFYDGRNPACWETFLEFHHFIIKYVEVCINFTRTCRVLLTPHVWGKGRQVSIRSAGHF